MVLNTLYLVFAVITWRTNNLRSVLHDPEQVPQQYDNCDFADGWNVD